MVQWTSSGKELASKILFGIKEPLNILYLGLYSNKIDPDEFTPGSLTELIGDGYSRQALDTTKGIFTDNVITYQESEFRADSVWPTIYGYFIVSIDNSKEIIIGIEPFKTPHSLKPNQILSVTPSLVIG